MQDTSYRASDVIEVRVHDFRKIRPALDSAFALGITTVSPVRYQATDVTAVQEAALREATERAHRLAMAIADAGGGRLGRTIVLTVDPEAGYGVYRPSSFVPEVGSDATSGVQAPSVAVNVTVHGRWEMLRNH